ncbi:MAG: hypothetical protein ACI4PF_02155, partial [Christensenellales bacterium]
MYKQYSDFSAHNTRTAVTSVDKDNLRSCTQAMRNLIGVRKSKLSDAERNRVLSELKNSKERYGEIADEHLKAYQTTYSIPEGLTESVDEDFEKLFEKMINLQRGYDLDKYEMYRNQFFGLIKFADDKLVNSSESTM